MKALIGKEEFIGLERCAYLFSGAETPMHRGAMEAAERYMRNRSLGPKGRELHAEAELRCKEQLAELLGGESSQIALMSNASEAISMIAAALPLAPGDNVVVHTLEFPSGVLPWLALKSAGIDVRVVPHRDWTVDAADVLAHVDERTKLVVTSHVSYLTGARIDYRALYEALSRTKTLLLLDATQSLGVIPVDASMADFVVCSTYKWLLSIHGGGILAVNPARVGELVPKYVGWRSVTDMFSPYRFESFAFHADARRFELAYPNYAMVYALEATTRRLLDVGVERIERHVLGLGDLLIEALRELGLELMTPADGARRAGNVSFLAPRAEEAAERLYEAGVLLWGGDGRIRASIHAFNDEEDIRTFVEALPACLPDAGGIAT